MNRALTFARAIFEFAMTTEQQTKKRKTNERRAIWAGAASLLLHGLVIATASRFEVAPTGREQLFTIHLDVQTPRSPKPLPRKAKTRPAPLQQRFSGRDVKPKLAPIVTPARNTYRPSRRVNVVPENQPVRQSRIAARPDAPSRRSSFPPAQPTRRVQTNRPSGSGEQANNPTLPRSNGTGTRGPRKGRPQENNFTFGNTDNGFTLNASGSPNAPFNPQAGGGGGSRRPGDGSAGSDSGDWTAGRGSRVAALPSGGSGNTSPSDPGGRSAAGDESNDTSFSPAPTRGTPSRRANRRVSSGEREADAPIPTPKPTPTPTPKPVPTRAPEPTPIPKAPEPPPKTEPPAPAVFRPARVRSRPQPSYPSSARAANQEGTTTLRLSISADGDVIGVDVVGSSGSAALDEAAARGARRWKYEPARRGDTPVASTVRTGVKWILED